MNVSRGYYSVIQYMPDASRMEAANVGVVIGSYSGRSAWCVKMANHNRRIERFFGSDFDWEQVDSAKQAVVERITSMEFFGQVKDYIATRANQFVLTPLRPMRIGDMPFDLDKLFQDLVE